MVSKVSATKSQVYIIVDVILKLHKQLTHIPLLKNINKLASRLRNAFSVSNYLIQKCKHTKHWITIKVMHRVTVLHKLKAISSEWYAKLDPNFDLIHSKCNSFVTPLPPWKYVTLLTEICDTTNQLILASMWHAFTNSILTFIYEVIIVFT